MGLNWQSIEGSGVYQIWDRICRESKSATFFHTRTWAEVLKSTFPRWSPFCITIEYSDGNLAVLPRMECELAPGFAYSESMLPGVYGGPIFMNPPTDAHWRAVWDGALSRVSNTIVFGNPVLSYVGHPRSVQRTMSTQMLDLGQGFDSVRKNLRETHRQSIRKARKNGIEVQVATDLESVDAYFDNYQDALRRWGKAATGFYPKALFHNLFRRSEYGHAIKLWIARLNESIIGGAWIFYHNDHAVTWHNLMRSAFMKSGATPYLLMTLIQDACQSGYCWFDFNPSGGHKGVEDFKAGFGARYVEFPVYRRLNPFGRAFRLYRYLKERYLRRSSL